MKPLARRFSLFIQVGIVGAMGAVIQECLLFALVRWCGLHPVLANTIAAETAIICNFTVNNLWTFGNVSAHILPKRFAIFNASALVSIGIQALVVWAGIRFLSSEWYLVYAGIGIFIGLLFNYVLYTRVIWRRGASASHDAEPEPKPESA
ncbi:MAG TPA: GtrA family protein [Candidatus Paceibacterota bacterium]|nr:GtrA family protein [Candidatus Paceibacterota bacterium]